MNLALTRPLVVLDCETTGTSPVLDRIVSFALLKVNPEGDTHLWTSLVNPEMLIPHEATYGTPDGRYTGHGITDEAVKDAPTWGAIGPQVSQALMDKDVAGYRLKKFDITILKESFARERIPDPFTADTKVIDAARLWQILEPRTLADAVRRYAPSFVFTAHDAGEDVRATWAVLQGQLGVLALPTLDDLDGHADTSVDALHELQWPWPKDALDPDGKIVWRDGAPRFTFGKHAGKSVWQVSEDYFTKFILKDTSDFTPEVKALARTVLAKGVIGPRA